MTKHRVLLLVWSCWVTSCNNELPNTSETLGSGKIGDPCTEGSLPIVCQPPAIKLADGSTLCTQGIAYCRDGVYSDCRYIQQYELTERSDEPEKVPGVEPLGSIQSALITPPGKCDDCHPDCFTSRDRPVDTDLKPGNSNTIVYDADAGAIRILSIVDGVQRGTTGNTAICGNRDIEDIEACDDGNTVSGDGCSASCAAIESGWFCPTEGAACKKTVCGNGKIEGDEQCDDANILIGDGCTPQCKREPICLAGICLPVCGDGNLYPGEGCDDGNTNSNDGCSSSCLLELLNGFLCVNSIASPPAQIDIPVVYRDFIAIPNPLTALAFPRHVDFEDKNNGYTAGLVQSTWGSDRKPLPSLPIASWKKWFSTEAAFKQWYNDDATVNRTFGDTLPMKRQPDGTYLFDSGSFFPLDGKAGTWVAEGRELLSSNHNFAFTSEVRFWFQYKSGQQLKFRGDDDVWVFINGKLAVDIGGVHGARDGDITLAGTGLVSGTTAYNFGLEEGKLYEAAVFQAERHTTGSSYKLTLAGFFFGKTTCSSVCGNGIVTPDEFCDDGPIKNGTAGFCQTDCQGRLPLYNPSATYWRDYAATGMCKIPPQRPLWGNLTYVKKATPTLGGSVAFKIQGAETQAALATAPSVTVTTPNSATSGTINVQSTLNGAGLRDDPPFVRVTAVLTASLDKTSSPFLQEFSLPFTCVNVE